MVGSTRLAPCTGEYEPATIGSDGEEVYGRKEAVRGEGSDAMREAGAVSGWDNILEHDW